jgi:hydroxymethylpyrimidine pyrophosphatase-like HAD family hydrolase
MARFYDIDMNRTIAIGDAFNDVSMFKVAGISVAVNNAPKRVKDRAAIVTEKTNKEGAVGEYINNLLDNPEKE